MRKIFFFSLLVSLAFVSKGQFFGGGIIGGITLAQIDGDSYAGYNKFGVNFGVFTNTSLGDGFAAQIELKYATRGVSSVGTEDDPFLYQVSLKYIDLPIVIQAYVTEKLSFEAGLSPGILMSTRVWDGGGEVPKNQIKPYNDFDLGMLVGANYYFNNKWGINVRYQYSLTPIRERTTANGMVNYSFVGRTLGLKDGDFNNYLSASVYYKIN